METKPNRSKPKPKVVPAKPRALVDEVAAAVKAASWITPADQAAVALAIKLARQLEVEVDARLGKLLVDVLGSLGLTVAGRGTKPQEVEREVNPLDALRERAAGRSNPTATRDPKPGPTK